MLQRDISQIVVEMGEKVLLIHRLIVQLTLSVYNKTNLFDLDQVVMK
jgi:hypothetical protein